MAAPVPEPRRIMLLKIKLPGPMPLIPPGCTVEHARFETIRDSISCEVTLTLQHRDFAPVFGGDPIPEIPHAKPFMLPGPPTDEDLDRVREAFAQKHAGYSFPQMVAAIPHAPGLQSYWQSEVGQSFLRSPGIAPIHIAHAVRVIEKEFSKHSQASLRFVLLEIPPGHGCSTILRHVSQWTLQSNDHGSVLWVCRGSSRAKQLETEIYKTKLSPERFRALPVGGTVCGFGADLVVIDAPCTFQEAQSETARARYHDWIHMAVLTRLRPGGVVVVAGPRLHRQDFASTLRTDIRLKRIVSMPTIMTGASTLERQYGEPLWPEKYSIERLLKIREEIGDAEWRAMYQQEPVANPAAVIGYEGIKPIEPDGPIIGEPILAKALPAMSAADRIADAQVFSYAESCPDCSRETPGWYVGLHGREQCQTCNPDGKK